MQLRWDDKKLVMFHLLLHSSYCHHYNAVL